MVFAALFAGEIGGRRAAMLTLVFLVLSPGFLGHSLMNPKDIPFAAGYVVSLYCMLRFIKEMPRPRLRTSVGLALGIGMALGTRVIGVILPAYLVLFVALDLAVKRTSTCRAARGCRYATCSTSWESSLAGYLVALLFWPFALQAPLRHTLEALNGLTNLNVSIRALFKGANVPANQVSWDYLPQWIGRTTPLFTLVGFVGLFFLGKRLTRYPHAARVHGGVRDRLPAALCDGARRRRATTAGGTCCSCIRRWRCSRRSSGRRWPTGPRPPGSRLAVYAVHRMPRHRARLFHRVKQPIPLRVLQSRSRAARREPSDTSRRITGASAFDPRWNGWRRRADRPGHARAGDHRHDLLLRGPRLRGWEVSRQGPGALCPVLRALRPAAGTTASSRPGSSRGPTSATAPGPTPAPCTPCGLPARRCSRSRRAGDRSSTGSRPSATATCRRPSRHFARKRRPTRTTNSPGSNSPRASLPGDNTTRRSARSTGCSRSRRIILPGCCRRARLALLSGNDDFAEKDLRRSILLQENAGAHYYLAVIQIRRGDAADALAHLHQAHRGRAGLHGGVRAGRAHLRTDGRRRASGPHAIGRGAGGGCGGPHGESRTTMKILVTGAGFIASHVVPLLRDMGHSITHLRPTRAGGGLPGRLVGRGLPNRQG